MSAPLDGFLLAAGLGTRMGSLSQALPKPAWTLKQRPLLQWGADLLRGAGCASLACNAHLHAAKLREVSAGLEVFEEPKLLGSAGGLSHAQGRVAEALLVWNADAVAEDLPFGRLKAEHLARRAGLSWLLIPHPGGPWSRVWLDEEGRVLPPGRTGQGPYHFTGAACWSPEALDLLPEGPSEQRDLLPRLPLHLGVVVEPFPWREVGTPDALIEAAAALAPDREGRLPGCYVHPTADPGPGSEGRFSRCVLGPGAAPPLSVQDRDALWFLEDGRQVRLNL